MSLLHIDYVFFLFFFFLRIYYKREKNVGITNRAGSSKILKSLYVRTSVKSMASVEITKKNCKISKTISTFYTTTYV